MVYTSACCSEYGNNCGCGPVICGVLRDFSVYSRCSWLGECVVATVCSVCDGVWVVGM